MLRFVVLFSNGRHSNPVCPNAKKYARRFDTCSTALHGLFFPHKSCNALALLVIPLSITLKLKQPQDTEKPHRKWSLWDYGYQVLPSMLFDRRGAYSPFKVPLPAHDKPMPFTVSTTENTLRETKQIRSSHFWQLTEAPSDPQVLNLQKPGSTWTSLKKHLQRPLIQTLNACLIMSWLEDKGLV